MSGYSLETVTKKMTFYLLVETNKIVVSIMYLIPSFTVRSDADSATGNM